jgi:pyridoxal phosphate enzyme (YggS family)
VKTTPASLGGRLAQVREALAHAARRSGRDAGSVRLVAVVKTMPAEAVAEAVALGIEDLGENRVQEAEEKIPIVGRLAARWHLVGHLQRNKAGRAVRLFDRIHGLDSRALAESLSRLAAGAGRALPVMIEVNVSGVASQFGVAPAEVRPLAEAIAALPSLALDGLMTVGAPGPAPESRRTFAALRGLRDDVERDLGLRLPELSMGMSGDFEIAAEEGSTMVRVGTALFGPRERNERG